MTPYGYRIVRGRAMIDAEEGPKVRRLFTLYLSGLSINEARKKADIPKSSGTASLMLEREIYLGDGFYPAIVTEETFRRAGQEKKRRNANGKVRMTPPRTATPVKTKFRVRFPRISAGAPQTAAEKAQLLYSFIRPAAYGDETISSADRARIREHLSETEQAENQTKGEQ